MDIVRGIIDFVAEKNDWDYEINPDILERVLDTKKAIISILPHTSFSDGIQGLYFKSQLEKKYEIPFDRIKYTMKESMFPWPVKSWLLEQGFVPVNRKNPRTFWKELMNKFRDMPEFWWAFCVEGTRKSVEKLEIGAFRAGADLNIPIFEGYLDYENKKIVIDSIIEIEEFSTDGTLDKYKLPALAKKIAEHSVKLAKPKNIEGFNPNIKIKGQKERIQ